MPNRRGDWGNGEEFPEDSSKLMLLMRNEFFYTNLQNKVLGSLHKLTKQNTIQTKPFLLRDRKKVSIRILFQKVFGGLESFPNN